MTDKYTKTVLTVIAGALLYLCVVMTPLPSLQAQSSKRPGEPTGPAEVVIVDWKSTAPIPMSAPEPIRVITERSTGVPDKVVLVGWEETVPRQMQPRLRRLSEEDGLPVVVRPVVVRTK